MIARIKAWLKERRIRRFKARFAEAYPDAAEFLSRVSWMDGDNFMIDAWLHVLDVNFYRSLTPEEEKQIRGSFGD